MERTVKIIEDNLEYAFGVSIGELFFGHRTQHNCDAKAAFAYVLYHTYVDGARMMDGADIGKIFDQTSANIYHHIKKVKKWHPKSANRKALDMFIENTKAQLPCNANLHLEQK